MEVSLPFSDGGPFWRCSRDWEAQGMTSLVEAERKFGHMVRDAGGAIFGIERAPSVGSKDEEKLQIGTADGFVKMAVLLNQPNIDLILRERTAVLVRHAEELRTSSRLTLANPPIKGARAARR
jgi:hypothetical protein